MSDHETWKTGRALSVQGITIEILTSGDRAALRRDGEITERGSLLEILHAFEVIERALTPAPKTEIVMRDEGGWISGGCA